MARGRSWIAAWLILTPLHVIGLRPVNASPVGIAQRSLCEVMKRSSDYVGQRFAMRVDITVYRHGIELSDPSCPKERADVQLEETPTESHFEAAIQKSRSNHRPLTATLIGTWLGKQNALDTFAHQPRFVFVISDSSDIVQVKKSNHAN